MNKYTLLFQEKTGSNLTKFGQWGAFCEFLDTLRSLNKPPTSGQYNEGLNLVLVETKLCADCLQKLLAEAGYKVMVAQTEEQGESYYDCQHKHGMVAAE
jgi:hypothetical protein